MLEGAAHGSGPDLGLARLSEAWGPSTRVHRFFHVEKELAAAGARRILPGVDLDRRIHRPVLDAV
ncbi:MAG TPA: hypothetical protein VNO79_05135 [Actinomycetota bacterium]|nr:hypothetical protein [Actinomycetota bacterium]